MNVSRSVMSDSPQPHGLYNLPDSCVQGILKEEYWSGFPFPSSGDLPDPGIKPGSLALQADSLPAELPGKPVHPLYVVNQLYAW